MSLHSVPQDKYRSALHEPRAFRTRRANRRAAGALLAGIVLVIVLLAFFA